ncbi:hypothetical protein [Streptomyces sp. NPDC001635]|nr:hypothetical protein E4K10_45905 [Streptomyces sp. T1317-0309]
MTGDKRNERTAKALGMSGASRTGGRRAAAVDLAVVLVALVAVALICRALGAATWLSLLIGGVVAGATTRADIGSRITRGGE